MVLDDFMWLGLLNLLVPKISWLILGSEQLKTEV